MGGNINNQIKIREKDIEGIVRDVLEIDDGEIDYNKPLSNYGLDERGFLLQIFDRIGGREITKYISGGSLNNDGKELLRNVAWKIDRDCMKPYLSPQEKDEKKKQRDRIRSMAENDRNLVNEITLGDIIEIVNYAIDKNEKNGKNNEF